MMIMMSVVKIVSDFIKELEIYEDMPELIPMEEEDF